MSYRNFLDNPIFHSMKRVDYGVENPNRTPPRRITAEYILNERGTKSYKKKKATANATPDPSLNTVENSGQETILAPPPVDVQTNLYQSLQDYARIVRAEKSVPKFITI
jgi:hypothetical protein